MELPVDVTVVGGIVGSVAVVVVGCVVVVIIYGVGVVVGVIVWCYGWYC